MKPTVASKELAKIVYPYHEYIISIGDIRDDAPTCFTTFHPSKRLRLVMDDVYTIEGFENPPSYQHIKILIQFIKSIPDNCSLLIHCAAGISRSTAVGLIVMCEKGFDYRLAYRILKRSHSNIFRPNKLLWKLYNEYRRDY